QQNGIDHTEDGGIGADSDRQHQHGNQSESRIFSQHAQGEANVLVESFHTSPFSFAFDQSLRRRLAKCLPRDWLMPGCCLVDPLQFLPWQKRRQYKASPSQRRPLESAWTSGWPASFLMSAASAYSN